MGRSADERWQATVLSMLDHRLPLLRAEAARAAGELEISEASPALFELVRDPNAGVRAAAIWSLSQIGGEGVRETLENLLAEADDDEETDFLETALDNLAFTEGMPPFALFDFPEDEADGAGESDLEDDDELFDFEDDYDDDLLDDTEDDDEDGEDFLD
jgi:HEAT repeat protein